jgi:hypothetical protein
LRKLTADERITFACQNGFSVFPVIPPAMVCQQKRSGYKLRIQMKNKMPIVACKIFMNRVADTINTHGGARIVNTIPTNYGSVLKKTMLCGRI